MGKSGVRAVAVAYDGVRDMRGAGGVRWRLLNVLLVAADCFFIGMQPILVFMTKVDGKFLFSPVSVNFLSELAKLFFALVIILLQVRNASPAERAAFSPRNVMKAARANVLLAVPSLLYAINNYLKFILQLYFKPVTVKMFSNLKILVIAVLLTFIMKRRFSVMQWEALGLLLIGITVNQLPCGSNDDASSASSFIHISPIAWLYTFFSVAIPSTAAVYNEYALKSQFETSVHLQNAFMFCYGLFFNFIFLVGATAMQGRSANFNIFHGHSHATMLLIANNALQGILSSFFFKYADAILKKYSSTIATFVTGVASVLLFHHHLTINFLLGMSVVLISMHQFFSAMPDRSLKVASSSPPPPEAPLDSTNVPLLPPSDPSSRVLNGPYASASASHHRFTTASATTMVREGSLVEIAVGANEEANHHNSSLLLTQRLLPK